MIRLRLPMKIVPVKHRTNESLPRHYVRSRRIQQNFVNFVKAKTFTFEHVTNIVTFPELEFPRKVKHAFIVREKEILFAIFARYATKRVTSSSA